MENPFVTKLKEVVKGRVVVFIDAANLEQSVKEMTVNLEDIPESYQGTPAENLRWSVDYRKLNELFRSVGVEKSIRFYTPDFQSRAYINFLYFLSKELDFKLIAKPLKKYHSRGNEDLHYKANFDVEIAVDATCGMGEFDTLVLFSGDCDFEYLIKFLRAHKKTVIGFSYIRNASTELQLAVNQYFDIENFKNEFLRITYKTGKTPDLSIRGL